LPLGQAAALEIRKSEEEEPGDARQLPAAPGQADSLPVPLNQLGLEEILQFLDLAAVLALPDRIARGGFRDAAGRTDFNQGAQPVQ